MIDAAKGFSKDGPKNRLREQDIHRIVDTFARLAEIPGYSRMVPVAEISDAKNDCNLNLPRYIDSSEPEDLQDINGHLRGGIPNRDIDAINRYWAVIPGVRAALFEPADRPGYTHLRVPATDIKATIFSHPAFPAQKRSRKAHLEAMRAAAKDLDEDQLMSAWRSAKRPAKRSVMPACKVRVFVLVRRTISLAQAWGTCDAHSL